MKRSFFAVFGVLSFWALSGVVVSGVEVPATDFPNDGVTAVYETGDAGVSFVTTNFFSRAGNFVGDGGGAGNLVNAYDGVEELQVQLGADAMLTGFGLRWTNSTLTIEGLEEDPQAVIATVNGNAGTATWNDLEKTLILVAPWDGGTEREVSFENPLVSAGRDLLIRFTGVQATFTRFEYEFLTGALPDPVVAFSFDEGTVAGLTVMDGSGMGNDGTLLVAGAAPRTGEKGLFGEAFGFAVDDDPDGVVTVAAGVVPAGAAERTFSFWFSQTGSSSQNKMFGYGGTNAGEAFDVGLESGGVRLRHFGGNVLYGSGFNFLGADAGWHHLAVRVNAGATTFAEVDVFLDGVALPVQASGATEVALNTVASELAIGSSAIVGSAIGFVGLIDEFQVWDEALTFPQIVGLSVRPPLPEVSFFKVSPQNRVPAGTPVTLSWEVENSASVILEPGGIDVTGQSSYVVTPGVTTSYTLRAQDEAGEMVEAEATVAIGAEAYPNIVVFFLDDFGWADWEQNGAPTGSVFYETPHMNRLAAEGLYFSSGYASAPVCSPTRGALMTGQAPAFNKLTDWITGSGDAGQPIREAEWLKELPTSTLSFPRVLSESGYRSIHVGKWHLGSGSDASTEPLNHGFDVNIGGNQFGTPPGPERYFASANGFSNLPALGPDVAPQGSYLTDVLTEQAVDQIQTAAGEGTAFALFLSHYAVHTPIQAPAATVAKYQAKLNNNPGMDWQEHTNPTYAAMIEHVDRSLGAVLAALEDPDGDPGTDDSIAGNTLVIFTADNGGLIGTGAVKNPTSNRPLRNGKGGSYEGGVREPWVFWMPGKIAPGVSTEPVITHDVYPTLLAQAGVANPAGHVVNGQDLSPLLAGQEFKRKEPVVIHYPHWSPSSQIGEPFSAVRQGDWKLLYFYTSQTWELYNVANDLGETVNLGASNRDREALLSWALSQRLEGLEANYPRNTGSLAEEPPRPLVSDEVDSDGDGRSDFKELLEGTGINSPGSFFQPSMELDESGVSFSFMAVGERSYFLEWSESMRPGTWVEIDAEEAQQNGGEAGLEDLGPLREKAFYRVRTELE